MNLSAPIHVLKSQAKTMKKEEGITMSEALNCIAKKEGFTSWSLLLSKKEDIFPKKYEEILGYFNPGDLVVIAARPMYGKTSFTIGLFVQAIKERRSKSYIFSLSEVHKDIAGRIARFDESIGHDDEVFELNYSDKICAEYIIEKCRGHVNKGSVIVVDYLQLLDEQRIKPPVQEQVEALKEFAKETGSIIIFISQVDREIEYKNDRRPTVDDIRTPNPLDKNLFNKKIFLYRQNWKDEFSEVIFSGKEKRVIKVNYDPKKIRFS